jgi:hypothetical protein
MVWYHILFYYLPIANQTRPIQIILKTIGYELSGYPAKKQKPRRKAQVQPRSISCLCTNAEQTSSQNSNDGTRWCMRQGEYIGGFVTRGKAKPTCVRWVHLKFLPRWRILRRNALAKDNCDRCRGLRRPGYETQNS